jgi:hypothetical protein
MTNSLPSLSLLKISNNNEKQNGRDELPVSPSNITEPTVTQGKIDKIRLVIYLYIIFIMIYSMGTFLRSIRSISR